MSFISINNYLLKEYIQRIRVYYIYYIHWMVYKPFLVLCTWIVHPLKMLNQTLQLIVSTNLKCSIKLKLKMWSDEKERWAYSVQFIICESHAFFFSTCVCACGCCCFHSLPKALIRYLMLYHLNVWCT